VHYDDMINYVPNLKSLSPPVMKIRKAMQKAENGVVWEYFRSFQGQ